MNISWPQIPFIKSTYIRTLIHAFVHYRCGISPGEFKQKILCIANVIVSALLQTMLSYSKKSCTCSGSNISIRSYITKFLIFWKYLGLYCTLANVSFCRFIWYEYYVSLVYFVMYGLRRTKMKLHKEIQDAWDPIKIHCHLSGIFLPFLAFHER